jgi:2-phospho-L-lactate guanylyltransferase
MNMTVDPSSQQAWRVVVPFKSMRDAKSRLGGSPGERRQLAIVMARDTLCAVANADNVVETIAVCSTAADVESFTMPGVRVLVLEGLALNDAIRTAEESVRGPSYAGSFAVLPGDLPYLRSSELAVALRRAGRLPRAMVTDRWGGGTTLLTATTGEPLAPAYGERSALAHRHAGVVELEVPVWSGLRRDVDTVEDLAVTPSLGFRTRRVLTERAALLTGALS